MLPVDTRALGGGLSGLSAAAAAFGLNMPGGEGSDANFVDILFSRSLRESLLKTQYKFHVRSWRFGAEREHQETLYAFLRQQNMDRAVIRLAGTFTASRDLKTKVLTITAETRSPELSQQIVRNAVHLLEEFVQQKGRTRGGFKAAFAEARLEEARRDLLKIENEFRVFLEGNRNYVQSTDPGVRLRGMHLETEYRLRQQLVTTLAVNREQSLLEEKNDIPILNVLDSGNLPIEKSRPTRSNFVLVAFLLVFTGTWGWANRAWIMMQLKGGPDPEPDSQHPTLELT